MDAVAACGGASAAASAAHEVVSEAVDAAWAQAFGGVAPGEMGVLAEAAALLAQLAQTARAAEAAAGGSDADGSNDSEDDAVSGPIADPGTASDSTYSASSFDDED
jgi:hypothetical protein